MTTRSTGIEVDPRDVSRRGVFGLCSLGVLGVAGLSACGGSDDSDDSGDSNAAATPAASEPAAGGGAGLVKVADVPVGSAVSVEVDGKPVIVSMPAADAPVAFSAVCPHKGVTVVVKGKQLLCPAHASTFDIATGANLAGPAEGKPLPKVAVKVEDGEVVQG